MEVSCILIQLKMNGPSLNTYLRTFYRIVFFDRGHNDREQEHPNSYQLSIKLIMVIALE